MADSLVIPFHTTSNTNAATGSIVNVSGEPPAGMLRVIVSPGLKILLRRMVFRTTYTETKTQTFLQVDRVIKTINGAMQVMTPSMAALETPTIFTVVMATTQ